MDYAKVASDVITAVGKDNLVAGAHCATRLRLVLKDDDKVDQAALDNNPDVKGTFKMDGQYQVIIGAGDVNHVYAELINQTGLKEVSTDEVKQIAAQGHKQNPIMAFIKILSEIFVPIIPALVAGGLLMAVNNIFKSEGLFGSQSLIAQYPQISGISDMLTVLADAPFIYMPVLLGISTAKRFGGNQYLGAALGLMMSSQELQEAVAKAAKFSLDWNFFGWHLHAAQYTSQVIPAIIAVWVMCHIEKWFHKHLHSAVDFTFTPLLTMIISGFLTFALIGPVFGQVSDWVANGLVWLYDTLGFLGMGIFGAFYTPIVVTGLHQSFPAFETILLNSYKAGHGSGDFIFVVASMANMAQAAAAFAIFFLTKNSKTKGLSSSAGISALLGITEPAVFGVNLKYRFPFFCALVGSAIAAAIAGLLKVIAVSLGSAGVLGLISINPKSIPFYLICEVISFAIAFAITYYYGKTKEAKVFEAEAAVAAAEAEVEEHGSAKEEASAAKTEVSEETIYSPVDGQIVELEKVNDPVFSSGAMGKGIAVKPSGNTVVSPVDGLVQIAFETGHAYGLKSKDGVEVLIHIGIDTVSLDGKGFKQKVAANQEVKKGDVLGTFDSAVIKDAGLDDTIMVIVTNTADYAEVSPVASGAVKAGDNLIDVK
ncbi:sucrose-specific PTS transporter subunit IIBC [Streptococcus sobrinus]|uniref:protein-N(pi)-phosphohistidine--sucrose phosphotransferase n=6 Tax=Bacteria TaxID=2 RepID=U2JAB7_9STRE|nr:sucrose-specific PTS transporter subunit IIBC [Streptococcus sobrinus]AWN61075.1 PTS beta-glucoside transporter subunit IIBCA [Streptococcus sobrinus]AWN62948.1 PTS beta-glucoside transporter subunit IIBCA [Streptococcus sobrinus]ERJ76730.1 PTS system sucrose-specific IIBC component [Streptococcus sobrinus W1703]OZV24170.1 PTS beta-glucoside transporter subunit EIIBCA [Streptococcus sobrinus]SQG18987.1 PTS system sucrose-specific transporter subunits IIBCA [Streptococcus sobrinus]